MIRGGNRNYILLKAAPFVSIITVVYNSENLLERTIQSVKNQSSNDYEFIIIDGGSTDGTLKIIQDYNASIDYWQSEPDKGIYDAMNKGLRVAKGKYVWFVNSGDEIENSDTLQIVHQQPADADIYYGETNCVDLNRKVIGTRSEISTRKLPLHLTYNSMRYGMVVSHQSIIVKRSIAAEYHLNYRCSADIDWVLNALKNSKKNVHCHVVLSKYLVGGYSLKNLKQSWKERFDIYLKHFGLIPTLWAHVVITLRSVSFKVFKQNKKYI